MEHPTAADILVLFDVDGTLVDNEHYGHRVAFNRAFKETGVNWNWDIETYNRLLKVFGGKERIRYYIEEFLTEFEPPENLDAFIRELDLEQVFGFKPGTQFTSP